MSGRLPIVVILGSTGSGKTKLSLELAKKFGGEVIGADSMQLYKGLDIITAKATKEEQSLAPHHMIDILEPKETFTVVDYRNKTVNLIDSLLEKNKMPIVVGGTNYYIESLLWKILIANVDSNMRQNEPGILPNNDHELPSDELHKKLKLLDPAMARRLHPNNKRKILRSLEVLQQRGRKHSELLAEQQHSKGGSGTGGGLRYPNSLVLWLKCEQEILDNRLNTRVDNMIKDGLVEELMKFHKNHNENRLLNSGSPDYTKGVFQSIGFKEFHPYLILSEEERLSDEGKKKLAEGVEQLKMVTRRYARKQNRWVQNRFLGRIDRETPPVYALDTTDVSLWEAKASTPAMDIVSSFVSGVRCPFDPLPVREAASAPNADDDTFACGVCERVFVGSFQWELHVRSNKHKRRAESLRKKQREEEEEKEVDGKRGGDVGVPSETTAHL